LRDDIKALFAAIVPLYRQKDRHLTQMLQNEREISFSLKSENIDNALILIDRDDECMEEIDHLDALIASARDTIAVTAGIDRDRFEVFFSATGDDAVLEMISLRDRIRSALAELAEDRERVYALLALSLKNTGKDIEELSRTARIRRLLNRA